MSLVNYIFEPTEHIECKLINGIPGIDNKFVIKKLQLIFINTENNSQ